ncbi:epi-neemfruitin B synthase L1AT-like [Tasmannia lanceolata]|uniref:epi-neemfruitin B synthase L1AT-like n=1 Tax=Tasmannia lanceolata TaxID=3420 RepID=UPI004062B00C
MNPPLPEYSFGNIYVAAISCETVLERDWYGKYTKPNLLEGLIRDAFRGIDSNFVRELQGPEGAAIAHKAMMDLAEKYSENGIDFFIFTSWWRFPFYEVDFGWGKPIWSVKLGLVDSSRRYESIGSNHAQFGVRTKKI